MVRRENKFRVFFLYLVFEIFEHLPYSLFSLRLGYSSESEAELDGPASEVILPQTIHSRGNIKSAKSAVRLVFLLPSIQQ